MSQIICTSIIADIVLLLTLIQTIITDISIMSDKVEDERLKKWIVYNLWLFIYFWVFRVMDLVIDFLTVINIE